MERFASRVLLVDDEKHVRESLYTLLELEGNAHLLRKARELLQAQPAGQLLLSS